MKKFLYIIIIVVISGFTLWRIFGDKNIDEAVIEEGISRVRVAKVSVRKVEKKLSYTGAVKGIKEAFVYSSVPGILRKKLNKVGDSVKKDEPIIMIDRDEVALEYSMSEIKSPIDGKVLEIMQDVGSRVTPQQPVAKVGDLSRVEVKVEVTPAEARLIRKGQKAEIFVDAYPERIFSGNVEEVGAALDRLSRKVPVKIILSNPRRMLKSQMVSKVSITVESVESALTVANTAVVKRSGKKGIFIVDGESIARWITPKFLLKGEEFTAFTGGNITEGDSVIIDGSYGLIPDRVVEIIE